MSKISRFFFLFFFFYFFTLEHDLTNVKRVFMFKLTAMRAEWIWENLNDTSANADFAAHSDSLNL